MTGLLWLAVLLFIVWIVVKFVFGMIGFVFHLLWIIAIILLVVWLVKKFL